MYRILLVDNYHAPDDEAASTGPAFDTLEQAVAYSKRLVDEFLEGELRRGIEPAALWDQYSNFGEDAVVLSDDFSRRLFSGWTYARGRCRQLQDKESSCLFTSTISPAASKPGSATIPSTPSTWTFTSRPTRR